MIEHSLLAANKSVVNRAVELMGRTMLQEFSRDADADFLDPRAVSEDRTSAADPRREVARSARPTELERSRASECEQESRASPAAEVERCRRRFAPVSLRSRGNSSFTCAMIAFGLSPCFR